ncbi:unnamed protein product, partial [marine sediment metagenome]
VVTGVLVYLNKARAFLVRPRVTMRLGLLLSKVCLPGIENGGG